MGGGEEAGALVPAVLGCSYGLTSNRGTNEEGYAPCGLSSRGKLPQPPPDLPLPA